MSAAEIIGGLARERVVETAVCNIAGRSLDDDLEDLCQMVYCILLEYDPRRIEAMHAKGQLRWFVVRIIMNQYRSSNSAFHKTWRRARMNARPLVDAMRLTEGDDD